MAYLEVEEMTTHIYEEDMDTISHGDDAAMMSAIDAAIEEVQGYLTKYDTGKIFAARGKERNPILLLFVKDIAAWHFCNICNAGVDIEMLRETLRPLPLNGSGTIRTGRTRTCRQRRSSPGRQECRHCGEMAFGSNRKRDNHF